MDRIKIPPYILIMSVKIIIYFTIIVFLLGNFNQALSSEFNTVDCETSRSDQQCMACNIYHEARGEPLSGQFMVGMTVANRVKTNQYPNSICEVIWQRQWVVRDEWSGYVAQFSWTWDGKSDLANDEDAWITASNISRVVIQSMNDDDFDIIVGDVGCDFQWYHSVSVKPKWGSKFKPVSKVGNHIFYCNPDTEIPLQP